MLVSRIEYGKAATTRKTLNYQRRSLKSILLVFLTTPNSFFYSFSTCSLLPTNLSFLQLPSPGPLALLARIGVRSSFAVLIIQASMAATISISYKPSYSILCLLRFIEHEYYTIFHLAAAILTKVKFVGRFLRVYAKPPSQPYVQRFLFLNTTIVGASS